MTETTQIIEFALGDERYCIEIDVVSEIVGRDDGELTPVPSAPSHVEGVMNLRGETSSIVDPFALLNVGGTPGSLDQVLVFDSDTMDGESVGWLVDDVYQVTDLSPDAVDDPPGDEEMIRGIVNHDEGFMIWVSPTRVET